MGHWGIGVLKNGCVGSGDEQTSELLEDFHDLQVMGWWSFRCSWVVCCASTWEWVVFSGGTVWWFRNPSKKNQLRLVSNPIIYRVLLHHPKGGWPGDFWTINSYWWISWDTPSSQDIQSASGIPIATFRRWHFPTQLCGNYFILLMDEIRLTGWYCKYRNYSQGLIHPRWLSGMSEPSTVWHKDPIVKQPAGWLMESIPFFFSWLLRWYFRFQPLGWKPRHELRL